MRVIAGTAKGRRLKSVPGVGTRPVTDRVKESVFGILGPGIEGCTFLDLFAGTGGVGIEALSRGAESCTFVDKDARAVATIRENLALTGLAAAATVVRRDSFRYLEETKDRFDVVYVAPPQYQALWERAMLALDRPDSPAADLVVVQIHPKEFTDLALTHLRLDETRKYGSTLVGFYVPRDEAAEGEAL